MIYEYNSMVIGAQNGNLGDEANSLLECLQVARCEVRRNSVLHQLQSPLI
jgi:hypothetical protein